MEELLRAAALPSGAQLFDYIRRGNETFRFAPHSVAHRSRMRL